MHPQQAAFVDAFKHWDADGMAHALTQIVQALTGSDCSEHTQTEIHWQCREFLDAMESGGVIHGFPIPEGELYLSLRGGYEWSKKASRNTEVKLELGFSTQDRENLYPEDLRERCRRLDLRTQTVVLDRAEVRVPGPLYGEPGYVSGRRGRPSIHRPPCELGAIPEQTYRYPQELEDTGAPPTFLHRYWAGECEQVWAELLALGEGVREEAILGDALAVVGVTMDRCQENIVTLVERLVSMGYEFRYPEWAYVPPDDNALERIANLEASVGPIPLALCSWYESVGSVDLLGQHPGWSSEWQGDAGYPDPLLVLPSEDMLTYDEENWYRHRYQLRLAPDDYHKEDVSGGPPYTIWLPNAAIDAPLEYEWHKTTFVGYLRECFRWGGFPGWARLPLSEDRLAILHELTEGLHPI
jgi:hypothetical protein